MHALFHQIVGSFWLHIFVRNNMSVVSHEAVYPVLPTSFKRVTYTRNTTLHSHQ